MLVGPLDEAAARQGREKDGQPKLVHDGAQRPRSAAPSERSERGNPSPQGEGVGLERVVRRLRIESVTPHRPSDE